MIEVTRAWTRPNTSVPWYQLSAEIVQHIQQNYVQPGKRLTRSVVDSPDGLTRTMVTAWTDIAAYNEFQADTTMQQAWAVQNANYAAAGVTAAPVVIV